MRKVSYDYEPEDWELLDEKGRKIDLIADTDKVSDEEFYAHLTRKRALTEKEAIRLQGGEYSESKGLY